MVDRGGVCGLGVLYQFGNDRSTDGIHEVDEQLQQKYD